MFTYGLGYRMCAGSILANRELYLIFIRLIHCFQIEKYGDVDVYPVKGNMNPTSLVAMPHRYIARFVPRNEAVLKKAINEFVAVQ
jgi:3-hydroxyphenylacetate 6-hydroxylase